MHTAACTQASGGQETQGCGALRMEPGAGAQHGLLKRWGWSVSWLVGSIKSPSVSVYSVAVTQDAGKHIWSLSSKSAVCFSTVFRERYDGVR